MKGGLTISLWALKALKELGFKGKRRIVFLATSDEEIGSLHSRQIIEEEARKSVCVFVPESSISPHGAVKTARKGVGIFKLKVKGVPVHAGIDPWSGVNAIEELALQIADLRKLSDRDRGVSVNVGVISGGTRTNVTAQYAEADIDVRFMTKEQGEELRAKLRNRQPYIEGAEITVEGDINRFPLERNESVVQLYHVLEEIAQSHGYKLGEGVSGGGSDGNFTAGLGIPTIDGLGPIGDGAHAEHEHVVLDNLPYRAALVAEAFKRYSKS
jgi:glutamate carboxypeptidase